MSRRRELDHQRRGLGEIRGIMNAMKTLAYMETRKLARFLPAQQAVMASIEAVAADFLAFHPDMLPETTDGSQVILLIGTERGFCGDFNQALLAQLEAIPGMAQAEGVQLLAVGSKLHPLLEGDGRIAALCGGANVVEEVSTVLQQLVVELAALQSGRHDLNLYAIYHGEDGVLTTKLLPPFRHPATTPSTQRLPPLLNLPMADFLLELTDHYLFAALHQMLYSSLMLENQRRVSHLEGAVRHLDERASALARQCDTLRQEEIIEEIEVILLSSASLDETTGIPR